MRKLAQLLLSAAMTLATAGAEAKEVVRVGVLTDMSGITASYTGAGSVVAARLAVEEFAKDHPDFDVVLFSADHQLKADIAGSIARKWFDVDKVDVLVDVPGSAIVLSLSGLVRDRNKVLLSTSSSSYRITGPDCTPNTVNWTYSTWSLANGTVKALAKQGGRSWFFITPDWEYGRSIQDDASAFVKSSGGTVLGSVLHPLGTSDFSAYLLQAQASKADIVVLTSGGSDMVTGLKQAAEFGIGSNGQKLSTMFFSITDAYALGLQSAGGLQFTTAFYWDFNDQTRAFARRFMARYGGRAPTDTHAAVYASVMAYLHAVASAGRATDGKAVVSHIRQLGWFEDTLFGRTRLREDGTVEHPMYVVKVKSLQESRYDWDYYKVLAEIPADQAFQPQSETNCPLVTTP